MDSGNTSERRRFIRHPSAVPITCWREVGNFNIDSSLRDISYGGISFSTTDGFKPGEILRVGFPSLRKTPQVRGQVVWTLLLKDREGSFYIEGLRFLNEESFLRVRVVEEICHIEAYRESQLQHHGRKLSSQQAAEEWIRRFAHNFPK